MSYLSRPRLHFWGKAQVNTVTSNNRTEDWNNQTYFDPANNQLDLGDKSPEIFREWMHRLNYEGYVNALWNYYGDNGIRLLDTRIISAELPDGALLSRPEEDNIIGKIVDLAGSPYRDKRAPAVLVDLDPTDGFTTQLFAQSFQIQDCLELDSPVRSHSRWVNSWRNLALFGDRGSSAIWQVAFPKAGLRLMDSNSPSLAALNTALDAAQGLVLRLCFYLFQHPPYEAVAAAYANNQRQAMPGEMVVAGTIGIWGNAETASLTPARILMPNPTIPLEIPEEIVTERRTRQFFLGAALAFVDTERKTINLDLINSIPEAEGFDTLNSALENLPEKINLGDLSLQVLDPETENCYCVGVLPFESPATQEPSYSKAANLLTGGIVEMPYPPELEEQIINGDLVLQQGTAADSPILLRENPYHLLVDERNVYFELEDPRPKAIPIQLLYRGKAAQASLVIRVEQSISQGGNAAFMTDKAPVDKAQHTQDRQQEMLEMNGIVDVASEITMDAAGNGVLMISPLQAGMAKLWLYTPTDPDLSQIRFGTTRYFLLNEIQYSLNLRVLPDDSHYDDLPNEALTWEFMQEHFFRYYSLLYPAMNAYINFDEQVATEAAAAMISAFVAESLFNSTIYMPITRELSAGKRRLVQRWARLRTNP